MTEHIICKDCKWNNYPTCKGTLFDGVEMNIETLKPIFECGIKFKDEMKDFISTVEKSELELLQEKYDELAARIVELEEKAITPTEK